MNKQTDFNTENEVNFDPTQANQANTQEETISNSVVDAELDNPATVAEPETPNPFKDLIVRLNTLIQGLSTKSDDYKTVLQQEECDKYTVQLQEFFSNFNHNYNNALVANQELTDAKIAEKNFERFIVIFNTFLHIFNNVAEFDLASAGEGIVNLTIKRDHYQEQLTSAKAKHERLEVQQKTAKNYAAEKLVKNSLKPFFQNMDNALKHLRKEEDATFKEFVTKLEDFQLNFFQQLQANNLEVFGVVGEDFDPNFHNALSMVPATIPAMHNKLAFVSSQGYKLHDRVVVPADVMVFFDPAQS